MSQMEYRRIGEDGKVIPGWTVLRDPQTGQEFDVLDVVSGRMPTPVDATARRPNGMERCALFGAPSRFTQSGVIRRTTRRAGAP